MNQILCLPLLLAFGLNLAWGQPLPPPAPSNRIIFTAAIFLMLETQARSRGFGSITAVAPLGYYASGLDGNPATLAQGEQRFGGFVNYSPWFVPSQIQVFQAGGWLSLGQRHSLGIQAESFSLRSVRTDPMGAPLGTMRLLERNVGLRYAMQLSPMVSMGLGFNLFHSLSDMASVNAPTRVLSVSADWGLWLHQEHHQGPLGHHWQVGISIQDLGPQIDYHFVPEPEFIPARLKGGGLFGVRILEHLDLDFAYQAQKLLVPSAGANQETGALSGAFQSFADSPEGLIGEWREIRHHVGLEQRWRQQGWWLALRQGYTYEHPFVGARQTLDFGASFGYRGIRFDGGMSYYLPLRNAPPGRMLSVFTCAMVASLGR